MRHRRWTLVVPAGLLGLAACGDPGPADAVRKTIGPGGGLIASHDDVLSIVILPGALLRDVEIEVFPSGEPPPIFGPAYRVRPQLELLVDAEVTYRRVLPSNADAAMVAVIRLDDYTAEMGHWVALPRLALLPEQQSVIAIDDELSLYYGLQEAPEVPPDDDDDDDDDDDGDSSTTGAGTSAGSTSGTSSDTGATTMAVESTDGSGSSSGGSSSGSTSEPGGSSSGSSGASTDDGMMVEPLCSDGIPVAGELCFGPGANAPAGLGPIDVGTGDLDGDGAVDVVTLDLATLEVGVLFGNGDGTLGAPGAGTVVTGMPVRLEVGDFTGEGDLDVAVLDTEGDAVLLLAGDGAGALAAAVTTPTGAGAVDMASANFDPGGSRDLAVLAAGANTVQLLLGGPGGLVAGPAAMVGAGIDDSIVTGSLNPGTDAFIDVMGVGATGYHAWATDGLGTGYIGEIPGVFGAGGTFVALQSGDIDGDGIDDVVGIDSVGDALVVGLGTGGAANFMFAAPLALGVDPSDVVLADLDQDGDLDAVVCNEGGDDVMVLAWGVGGYALALTFDTGVDPSGVAVAQLDADGVLDVVVANAGSDTVTVLLSDP